MIEINLIPDVKQELLRAQRSRSMVISSAIITSIVAAGIVALLAVYVFGVQAVRSGYLDGQITKKSEELSKVEDLSKILTIQNQLATISQLNDKKMMSSRVFDVISAITPPGEASVAFSQINIVPTLTDSNDGGDIGVSADKNTQTNSGTVNETTGSTGGQFRLEGQTASYQTMEIFKKRIENTSFKYTGNGEEQLIPLAKNISTSDISYGEDATGNRVVRFSMTFEYPPELFSSKTTGQDLSFKLMIAGNATDSYIGIPRFTTRASDIQGGN